jgi:hypothetical protein
MPALRRRIDPSEDPQGIIKFVARSTGKVAPPSSKDSDGDAREAGLVTELPSEIDQR